MNADEILNSNYEIKDDSFLYYLLHKRIFHKDGLRKLCESIYVLAEANVNITHTAQKINVVYGEILKCFLYHFDANDPYIITNMPENYNRMINQLEKCVEFYFNTRISG